jgi:predicted glutamine amidotransferase
MKGLTKGQWQSFAARERLCESHSTPPCINGDGFGVGWYSNDLEHDSEPCIYRSTRPVSAMTDDHHSSAWTSTCVRIASLPASMFLARVIVNSALPRSHLHHPSSPLLRPPATPQAWNDENLMQLSEKIQSHLLFAHVRAATPGSVVAERLCHPFRSVPGWSPET